MLITKDFLKPRYWPIWVILGVLRAVILLPFKWQLALGRAIGRSLLWFPSKMKRTSITNLQLCFPELTEPQREALLHKSFESVGMGVIETALGWWASDEKLKNLVKVNGIENVEVAFQKGKGIILCCGHFASLELAGRLFAQRVPIAVMYRPQKNPLLEKITRSALEKHYKAVVPREDVRGMLRCLKNNMAIFYTPDVDAGVKNSVFVPFFGIPAASVTATPRYAKMSGALLVPGLFYRRTDYSGYDIFTEPALANFPSEDLAQDVTCINRVIEDAVRRHPEQYIWQYKRFKTRPPGEARFYK